MFKTLGGRLSGCSKVYTPRNWSVLLVVLVLLKSGLDVVGFDRKAPQGEISSPDV